MSRLAIAFIGKCLMHCVHYVEEYKVVHDFLEFILAL
jgi:hypothetical protein